jgi:predicted MFS family arabinose efflux permease
MLSGYRQILRSREFVIYLAMSAASYTGLVAWLSAAPFVLQSIYGQTPLTFSLMLSLSAVGYMIGALIASRIVVRVGIGRTVGAGACAMILGAVAMCLVVALRPDSAIMLIAAVAIYLAGFGLVFPPSIAGGLSAVAERAGSASSLLGFAPQFSAAILSAVVVAATNSTAWPAAIAVSAIAVIVLLFWFGLPRTAKP